MHEEKWNKQTTKGQSEGERARDEREQRKKTRRKSAVKKEEGHEIEGSKQKESQRKQRNMTPGQHEQRPTVALGRIPSLEQEKEVGGEGAATGPLQRMAMPRQPPL